MTINLLYDFEQNMTYVIDNIDYTHNLSSVETYNHDMLIVRTVIFILLLFFLLVFLFYLLISFNKQGKHHSNAQHKD